MENKKAIIECIKDYIKKCPYLDELAKIKVDYLNVDSKESECWSLEQLEIPNILGTNVLKTKTFRQCQFIIASRVFFNIIDDTQNINNLLTFEKIADWLYMNNAKRLLPTLNNGETPTSIEVMSGGCLYGTNKDNTVARYQMTCKLLYEKKEESIWQS